MENMKKIAPNELPQSVIDIIGKEWMLVSAGNESKFNTMTVSWGTIGFMFNMNVATIVVRPERYTYEFIENESHFTLTILDPAKVKDGDTKQALTICGRNSGRDMDKVAKAGLTPRFTADGNPTFEEARIVLECRKVFGQMMSQDSFVDKEIYDKWYDEAHGNLHKVFIGEIVNCWIKE